MMLACLVLLGLSAAAAQMPQHTFGTSVSGGYLNATETVLLDYTLSATGKWGTTTHFWVTGTGDTTDSAIIRYYIDGETTASIQFQPALACGVGSGDNFNPWGHKWAGKGGEHGAWYNKFRIPFYKSLRVTYQSGPGIGPSRIWMQVRGVENLQIGLEGMKIPTGQSAGEAQARMQLQVFEGPVKPLDFVNVVTIPAGKQGQVFSSLISFTAPNFNTLEGCVHWYETSTTPWPGVMVASGSEDYPASSYYGAMSNGQTEFHFETSGITHKAEANGVASWSMYIYHVMDPLVALNGGSLTWRNGDTTDEHGEKCFVQSGGSVVGKPGIANVTTYGWSYVW